MNILDIAKLVANLLFAIIFFGGYFSILNAYSSVQSSWKTQWSNLVEKPEFSYCTEGKMADLKALGFFLQKKYEVIPDPAFKERCEKVRTRLIVFPCVLFALAAAMFFLHNQS